MSEEAYMYILYWPPTHATVSRHPYPALLFARARCRWSRSLAVPATGLRARWPRPGVRGLNCGHCATTTARRERKFHLLLAVQMWRNEVCQSTCCNDACG